MLPSMSSPPIPAATVILLRDPFEVYLVKRHAKSGFMANAFVFPGGKVDEADRAGAADELDAARAAAVRELAEEAAVTVAAGDLRHWAYWITPAFEPRRFAAHFFVTFLPSGQVARHDDRETTDELWIAPAEALERQLAGTLRLPPPTIKTLEELAEQASVAAALEEAARRAPHVRPIVPKFQPEGGELRLLLPWDAEYGQLQAEGVDWPPGHPLARGSSRIELRDGKWWTR